MTSTDLVVDAVLAGIVVLLLVLVAGMFIAGHRRLGSRRMRYDGVAEAIAEFFRTYRP